MEDKKELWEEFLEWKTNRKGLNDLFEMLSQLDTRITRINNRTKNEMRYIRDFDKRLKELEKTESTRIAKVNK